MAVEKERVKKARVFASYLAKGRELWYSKAADTLYTDLNDTLTDKHLGLAMLEFLGGKFSRAAKEVLRKNISYRERIGGIARLLKEVAVDDFLDASERASQSVSIARYIKDELASLKPTRLVIFTGSPQETADAFVQTKICPLYNAREAKGGTKPVFTYGTLMKQEDGLLTGGTLRIIDKDFRVNLRRGIEQKLIK